MAKVNVPDLIWYIDFWLLKNLKPSSTSIFEIQTLIDIDF